MKGLKMTIQEKLNDNGIYLKKGYGTGNQKVLCPKCSNSRKKKDDPCLSVTINDEEAVWYCHNGGCGFQGGTRAKVYNRPAMVQTFQLNDYWRKYLTEQRKISEQTIAKMQIYSENNKLCFPYFRGKELINIKYRTDDKRFHQVKDAEKIVYNLNAVKETLIWVEGEVDALSFIEAGFENVISVPEGGTNENVDIYGKKLEFITNCSKELESVKTHILAFDNDQVGLNLREAIAKRLGKEKCLIVDWGVFKDAGECFMALGYDGIGMAVSSAVMYPLSGINVVLEDDCDGLIEYLKNRENGIFSTGWQELDKFYKVRAGEVTVITGKPNEGKSEFLDCLIMNLLKMNGHKFMIASFENDIWEHKLKLVQKFLNVSVVKNEKAFIENSKSALQFLHRQIAIVHATDEAVTVDWILEKAKTLVLRMGIFGLVIDPYNQIEHRRPQGMTEHEYIGDVLRKVRSFAKNYGVHVFFVAHPRKIYKDEAVDLYSISGSANWANMADNGIVIAREEDTTIVSIKKIRFQDIVGKRGDIELFYDAETVSFDDKRKNGTDKKIPEWKKMREALDNA